MSLSFPLTGDSNEEDALDEFNVHDVPSLSSSAPSRCSDSFELLNRAVRRSFIISKFDSRDVVADCSFSFVLLSLHFTKQLYSSIKLVKTRYFGNNYAIVDCVLPLSAC